MAFPTDLDTVTAMNPNLPNTLSTEGHNERHTEVNTLLSSLQAKVGVDSSAVTSSLDYITGVNATNISTNTADIATNVTDIATNASDLAALDIVVKNTTSGHDHDGTDSKIVEFNVVNGHLINGYIYADADGSYNGTLKIKTNAGTDPTASNPVLVIGSSGSIYRLEDPLTMTLNAGTNWFNLGSDELLDKSHNLFVFVGKATSGYCLCLSRIPKTYSNPNTHTYHDFSDSTAENFLAVSDGKTIYNGVQRMASVGMMLGRLQGAVDLEWWNFSAVSYHHVDQSDRKIWIPTYTCSGSMTYTGVSNLVLIYWISKDVISYTISVVGTLGGVTSNTIYLTVPYSMGFSTGTGYYYSVGSGYVQETGGSPLGAFAFKLNDTTIGINKYDRSNFVLGAGAAVTISGHYLI